MSKHFAQLSFLGCHVRNPKLEINKNKSETRNPKYETSSDHLNTKQVDLEDFHFTNYLT